MSSTQVALPEVLTAAVLADLIGQLQQRIVAGEPRPGDGADDVDGPSRAERIDRITQFERLKAVCAAGQLVHTAAVHAAAVAGLAGTEQRREKTRASVASEVALARRCSPNQGNMLIGAALALTLEMPHTMAALTAGDIGEYQATLVVRETSTLTREDRVSVDRELAGKLASLGLRATRAEAARAGYRLDPGQAVKRIAKAEKDARVSVRPAADGMVYLTGLVRLDHGVAGFAALDRYAATAKASGDNRSRGQIMAAELISRLLTPAGASQTQTQTASSAPVNGGARSTSETPAGPGHETGSSHPDTNTDAASRGHGDVAADTTRGNAGPDSTAADVVPASLTDGMVGLPTGVGLDIQLVMTDRALLDGDDEPAILTGHGPIPAALARHLIHTADPTTRTWVRRLYTDPHTGNLTGADTTRRLFPPAARQFLTTRDQVCRTPWCDAPIRHADHITAHHHGGPTTPGNGQGLCQHCNHTKETPGWTHTAHPDGTITITTPTGHHHRSTPPPPPRSAPWEPTPPSPAEQRLQQHLRTYSNLTWVSHNNDLFELTYQLTGSPG